MARMPAGTMRFAQSGGQDLTLDITDGTKKTKVLDTIIPKDSKTEIAYRTALANALGIQGNEQLQKVSSANFTELMITGNTTINGKAVTMTEQRFMLCAYGDCTNPGVALKVGKIKTPDIPGSATVDISAAAESIITEEVVRYSSKVGTRSVSFGIAG